MHYRGLDAVQPGRFARRLGDDVQPEFVVEVTRLISVTFNP